MTKQVKLTPMLQQYLDIKKQHENTILFYRMGDFYEMFFDDAVIASKILGITLTSRNKKEDKVQVPMCGIPYHAIQSYLGKLIKAGKRVAICEQIEDPAESKGIVKREVVRVVSPGVITDNQLLDDKSNNYTCSICFEEKSGNKVAGISFLDVSTGEFSTGEYPFGEKGEAVLDHLTRLVPAEILMSEKDAAAMVDFVEALKTVLPEVCITEQDHHIYHYAQSRDLLLEHFEIASLDGFGLGDYSTGITSAGALLHYVQDTQKAEIHHIEKLIPFATGHFLHIDDSSRRNLELTQTIIGGSRQGSLLSVLDKTCTPMGARLLKNNLLFPLRDCLRINSRLDAISFLFKNSSFRKELRSQLETVSDLERLNSRVILGVGNGRDLLALKRSLFSLPSMKSLLQQCDTHKLISINREFDTLADIHTLLEESINEEAPVTLRDGNLIKEGYSSALDELVTLLRGGKRLILDLEAKEREATGIGKLKIGYNKVFGYYIEVSKIHAENVPDHYIRKQTLVNAERFITPELKDFETKVLGAQEKRVELEYNIFLQIRESVASNSSRILKVAGLIAQLDFLASSAEIAQKNNYRRPEIHEGDEIRIVEGRHPVIETSLPAGKFVPNDVYLNQTSDEVLIITGPNMAGKSTVLRQTALIVLMAQMGCYVPADTAEIGIVDRIFTRVGAMDDLRRGQSTFMVEMSETANILNNATEHSLVILDEIGRGTSTYDGLSIAWAVTEELLYKNSKGVKTLFATHYHELTELAANHQAAQNYSIAVKEWKDTIIFLHKLVKGGTSRSYGIQVASLAGVPDKVVKRARRILRDIELGKFEQTINPQNPKKQSGRPRSHPGQLCLFSIGQDPALEYLKKIEPDNCSPRDALEILYTLKNMIDSRPG